MYSRECLLPDTKGHPESRLAKLSSSDTWKHTFKTDNTFPFPFTCFISDWISDTFHNILWNNFYVEGHSYSKKPDRNLFRKDFTLGETVQQLTLKCMGNKKETDRWIDGCTLSNNISIPGRL